MKTWWKSTKTQKTSIEFKIDALVFVSSDTAGFRSRWGQGQETWARDEQPVAKWVKKKTLKGGPEVLHYFFLPTNRLVFLGALFKVSGS